jgi:hypothetical protein
MGNSSKNHELLESLHIFLSDWLSISTKIRLTVAVNRPEVTTFSWMNRIAQKSQDVSVVWISPPTALPGGAKPVASSERLNPGLSPYSPKRNLNLAF